MDLSHLSLKLLVLFLSCMASMSISYVYDSLEPDGNISNKWDILDWDSTAYDVGVSVYNYRLFRHGDELNWWMQGAEPTELDDNGIFGVVIQSYTGKDRGMPLAVGFPFLLNKCQSDAPSWLCIVCLSLIVLAIMF